jgi:hypothetical protein
VVEVEVASETAVDVEVVDEADLEIVVVVEGVEAALTVAASATSLARRSPSKASSTPSVLSVRLGLQQLAYAASHCTQTTSSSQACYGHPFCVPAGQDSACLFM